MAQTLWLSDTTSELISKAIEISDGEKEKTQIVRDALREYISNRDD